MGVPRWTFVPAVMPLAAVVAVDPSGLAPFGALKWLAVGALTLAAATLAFWRGPLRLDRSSTLLWGALVLWVTVSSVAGLARWEGVVGSGERHSGLLLWVLCALAFLVGQQAGDAVIGGAGAVVAGLLAAGFALGTYGLVELWWRAPVGGAPGDARLGGPFGSPAHLGAVCALLLPVATGVWLERLVPMWWRVLAGAIAAGLLVVVVGSGTRGAWLGVAVAAAYTVAARRSELRAVLRDALVVVVVAASTIALAFALAPERGVSAALARETRVTTRVDEWRVATAVIADHPLLGAGPEGFRIAFPAAVDAGYEQSYGRVVVPDRAYASVLDIAASIGLPGLALYGALVVVVARRVRRLIRRGDLRAAGLGAGLLAYVVQALFLYPVAEFEPVVWLLAGLLVAVDIGPAVEREALVRLPAPRLAATIAGCVTALIAVAGVREVLAEHHARSSTAASGVGRTQAAAMEAGAAVRARPDLVRYRVLAARAMAADRQSDAAVAELDAATRLSPHDPDVRIERARLLGTAGAWSDVVAHDPRNGTAWQQFGQVLAGESRLADAEAAWLRAKALAPRDVTPALSLARLYLDERRLDRAAATIREARAKAPGDPRVVELEAALDAVDG